MTQHPNKDMEDKAAVQANEILGAKLVQARGSQWWREYREAYAQAAGVYKESPVPLDATFMEYLAALDAKVAKLRRSEHDRSD